MLSTSLLIIKKQWRFCSLFEVFLPCLIYYNVTFCEKWIFENIAGWEMILIRHQTDTGLQVSYFFCFFVCLRWNWSLCSCQILILKSVTNLIWDLIGERKPTFKKMCLLIKTQIFVRIRLLEYSKSQLGYLTYCSCVIFGKKNNMK